jgi:hypothetical protein
MTLPPTLFDPIEGERRKLAALTRLAARREALVRRGRRALLQVLLERPEATADHVRQIVELPAGINAKVFGAAPGELAEAGIIVAAGFAKSARPEAHARLVQIWRLADRTAAIGWLRSHPDLPDVPDAPGDLDNCNLFDSIISTKNPAVQTPGEERKGL